MYVGESNLQKLFYTAPGLQFKAVVAGLLKTLLTFLPLDRRKVFMSKSTVTYTIYTITPAPSAQRGAAWARYGVMPDRDAAVQMARDLFDSREFSRVEVHETRLSATCGSHSRLHKAFIRRNMPRFLRWATV